MNRCQQDIPISIKDAIICLLYKKGDITSLANWRPISLLNVDYKLLTKIINNRMKNSLKQILHPDQKGFVPARNLDDAVIKVRQLMYYCTQTNRPDYLLLLDQEKAFDRVARDFMHKVIEKFDFPPLIMNTIKSIYRTTLARISVNGHFTSSLALLSGVRQGCPLSPTLFAMCIETLGNLIKSKPDFSGIHVPGINTFKLSEFADDTTIFIHNQHDLDIALDIIEIYEQGSGAKANVSKTEIYPFGPNFHSTINPLSTTIQILPYESHIRFLGVQLTNTELPLSFWDSQIEKLNNSLQRWNRLILTFNGRIFVLKTQALSSFLFHAKFHIVPNTIIDTVKRAVKSFVTKGRKNFIVRYSIAQLPRALGGLDAPDIDLLLKSVHLRWIPLLVNPSHHSERTPLTYYQTNLVSEFPKHST